MSDRRLGALTRRTPRLLQRRFDRRSRTAYDDLPDGALPHDDLPHDDLPEGDLSEGDLSEGDLSEGPSPPEAVSDFAQSVVNDPDIAEPDVSRRVSGRGKPKPVADVSRPGGGRPCDPSLSDPSPTDPSPTDPSLSDPVTVEPAKSGNRPGGRIDVPTMIDMHGNGMTLKVIGEFFGVTRERVRQVAKEIGLQPRLAAIRERNAKVVEAAETMTDSEIATRMGLSKNTVSMIRRQNGLSIQTLRRDRLRPAVEAVAGGVSIRQAAFTYKMSAMTLSKYCEAEGVASTHGRWGALEHRAEVVPDMLARGYPWEEILTTLSTLEKREVQIQALKAWLHTNIPALDKQVRSRRKLLGQTQGETPPEPLPVCRQGALVE